MSQASNPNDSKPPVSFLDTIEETLSEEQFGSSSILEDSRTLDERGLDEKTVQLNFKDLDLEGDQTRFTSHALLGVGANSHVYEVHDRNLQRKIAVKTLRPDKKVTAKSENRFIQEARVIARLEHPGVLPLHDLRYADSGEMVFSMRKVDGLSLGAAIREEAAGNTPDQIATLSAKINLIISVCDTLSFAHAKGIYHQDIKPDNIMLGQYGEVIVVDWGTASINSDASNKKSPIVGTPAYMAPEQARREKSSASADIYCLGSTFFHLLFGRHVTKPVEPDTYWDKKRHGIIDAPTPDERSHIPPKLYAILSKAIAADSSQRYQSISDFRDDLRHFLDGHAVTAYRENIMEKSFRWYSRNRTVTNMAAVLLIVISISLYRWYDAKQKLHARWGDPIIHETFDDESWKSRWVPWNGTFKQENGSLVTQSGTGFNLVFNQRLYGNVAVEYTGQILSGHAPGDLSITWLPEVTFNDAKTRVTGVDKITYFQLGAYDNNFAAILHNHHFKDINDFRLTPQKKHKMRVEMDNGHMRIFADGNLICQYYDPLFSYSGYIGLYGYFSGKAYDDIKIYSKGVPEVVSIVGVGDAFYKAKKFPAAKQQYESIIRSHPDKQIAIDARYKLGLTLWAMDQEKEAIRNWQPIYRTKYQGLINYHQLTPLYKAGKRDQVINLLRSFYQDADEEGRQHLRDYWSSILPKESHRSRPHFDALIAMKKELFPNNYETDFIASIQFLRLGKYQHVIDRFPHISHIAARACFAMGEYQYLLDNFPSTGHVYQFAQYHLRRYHDILGAPEVSTDAVTDSLIALGRPDEALIRYPNKPGVLWKVHRAKGEFKGLVEKLKKDSQYFDNLNLSLGTPLKSVKNEALANSARASGYFHAGQYDELKKHFPKQYNNLDFPCYLNEAKDLNSIAKKAKSKTILSQANYYLGHGDVVKSEFPYTHEVVAKVYYGEEDYDAIENYPQLPDIQVNALIRQGRDTEILDYGRGYKHFQQIQEGLSLMPLVDKQHVQKSMQGIGVYLREEFDFAKNENEFNRLIYPALLRHIAGKPDSCLRLLGNVKRNYQYLYHQRAYHSARYIMNDMSDADFMAQPFQLEIQGRLVFAQAARAILHGDKATARNKLLAYQDLPYWQKPINALQDRFVSWMLGRLDTASQ